MFVMLKKRPINEPALLKSLMKFKKCLILLLLLFPIALFAEDETIRVAVFEGEGVGPSSVPLIASFPEAKGPPFKVSRITADEIRKGKLADYDVVVHPGGSGGKQGRTLGEIGRKAVQDYIRGGGGFLGVCGGAYLATNDYDWSLDLIDAKVVDRKHWARGKGDVQLQLSLAGAELFGQDDQEMTIHYAQGPLLGRPEWDDPGVPNYESLAIFTTEIAKNGAPVGVMARTSAAVRTTYGKGRVFCFSPHPELTDGLSHLIPLAVQWAAGEDNE